MKGFPCLNHYLLLFIFFLSVIKFAHTTNYPNRGFDNSNACNLQISKVIVGDCEYGNRTNNQSKVLLAVYLKWVDPVAGSKIKVEVAGQAVLFDPFEKGNPPFVQFVLTPDGTSKQVTAAFTSGACSAIPQTITLPSACDPPVCSGSNAMGGVVFYDYNGNGIKDPSETGFPGVGVTLYNDANQLVAATSTKTNGIWAREGLTPSTKLRVEFEVPTGLFDGNVGSDNKTRTQFAAVGDCNVNLGIYTLQELIDPNPWMVTSCFSKGDANDPKSQAFTDPSLVANLYETPDGGPRSGPGGNYYLASSGETGSVWGISFQKETKKLFSAAFLKRQCSVGPGGLSAIYVTDMQSFLPSPPDVPNYRYYGNTSILLKLEEFGIKAGDIATLKRDLPIDPNAASHDAEVFDKVGKWGLGDLEINDAGDTLYVVNLYNRSLVVINIKNPLQLPITADRIAEFPIPDPGCKGTDNWRPWGLKYKNGTLYVGGVCSAESTKNPDDLTATVYTFKNKTFTPLLSLDLNYRKGFLNDNYCGNNLPWVNDFYAYQIGSDVVCGPVPILSDIEFDSEGNMLLGFGDRFGHQSGGKDFGTNPADKRVYISFSGGDLLKTFHLKGNYLVEKNATAGFFTTPGKNNGQGINGGEFFFQDAYVSHQESVLGALAVHPSYNTVVATLMDPGNIWSNGWSLLNNSDGQKNVNYHIYTGENGTFGKASGLGDIELLIGSSTVAGVGITIGNVVWEDLDEDGMQDPGEPKLSGVKMLLCDKNGAVVSTTTTNSDGEYYFKGLEAQKEYFLQVGTPTDYVNGLYQNGTKQYLPTIFRTRVAPGNRENDSDASQQQVVPPSLKGFLTLGYKTGKDGENDFSIDFGLLPCNLKSKFTLQKAICANDSVKVGNQFFSQNNLKGTVVLPNASFRGCDSTITVDLSLLPLSSKEVKFLFCPGEFVTVGNQLFNETNPTGSLVFRNASATGCDSIVNVNLAYHPKNSLWLPEEYEILYGDKVQLIPTVDREFVSYQWTLGYDLSCVTCFSPVAGPFITNDYKIEAVDEYGCFYTTVTRIVVKKDKTVHVPNIFTPNGDGRNDKFTLYGNRFLTLIEELRIYDRWGNLEAIIENIPPNDIQYGWDGTVDGKEVVPGVFVYVARVRFLDNSTETLSGDVTVMR